MAAAFGTRVNVTPGTGTNTGASPSITTPTTNPVVFVHVALKSTTAVVNSLTITGFGGTPSEVKSIRTATSAADCFVSVWKIVAPTANTAGTVQANLSASVPYQMVVETFSGADQTDPSPTGDAVSNAAITSPITLTPTNLTASDASTGSSGNTEAQDLGDVTPNSRYTNNTTAVNLATGDATGTTGLTFSVNLASFPFSKVAVRVKAYVAPVAFTNLAFSEHSATRLIQVRPWLNRATDDYSNSGGAPPYLLPSVFTQYEKPAVQSATWRDLASDDYSTSGGAPPITPATTPAPLVFSESVNPAVQAATWRDLAADDYSATGGAPPSIPPVFAQYQFPAVQAATWRDLATDDYSASGGAPPTIPLSAFSQSEIILGRNRGQVSDYHKRIFAPTNIAATPASLVFTGPVDQKRVTAWLTQQRGFVRVPYASVLPSYLSVELQIVSEILEDGSSWSPRISAAIAPTPSALAFTQYLDQIRRTPGQIIDYHRRTLVPGAVPVLPTYLSVELQIVSEILEDGSSWSPRISAAAATTPSALSFAQYLDQIRRTPGQILDYHRRTFVPIAAVTIPVIPSYLTVELQTVGQVLEDESSWFYRVSTAAATTPSALAFAQYLDQIRRVPGQILDYHRRTFVPIAAAAALPVLPSYLTIELQTVAQVLEDESSWFYRVSAVQATTPSALAFSAAIDRAMIRRLLIEQGNVAFVRPFVPFVPFVPLDKAQKRTSAQLDQAFIPRRAALIYGFWQQDGQKGQIRQIRQTDQPFVVIPVPVASTPGPLVFSEPFVLLKPREVANYGLDQRVQWRIFPIAKTPGSLVFSESPVLLKPREIANFVYGYHHSIGIPPPPPLFVPLHHQPMFVLFGAMKVT